MMIKKRIAVFGSGTAKENSAEWKQACKLGELLARAGFVVVNGGYGGLMCASAKGAKDAGGDTVGVTVTEFSHSKANPFIDEEVRVDKWHDRVGKLMEIADGFIVLDGGTGTLVELITVWEMLNRGLMKKPAVVLGKHMKKIVSAIAQLPDVGARPVPPLTMYDEPLSAVAYLRKELI